MFETPNNFGKHPQLSQMSFAPNVPNITTGNGLIDQLMSMLMMGSGVAPRPHAGQSIMEAFSQRERSQEFLKTMRRSFGQQLVAQKLGGGPDPNSAWGSMVSMFLGQPDGIANNPLMRAFNGGNPIKAAMAMQANLTGMTHYMGTGRLGNASFDDVNSIMAGATKSLFHTKTFTRDDASSVQKTQEKKMLDFINDDADRKARFAKIVKKDANGVESVDMDQIARLREAAKKGIKPAKDEAVKAMASELERADEMVAAVQSARGKVGQLSPVSVNFEKTRGFEIQDLTKSMTMAMDVGAFDMRGELGEMYRKMGTDEKHASREQQREATTMVSNSYFDKAGSSLRAMSDLTGAETAEESMQQLNSFVGQSKLNMANQGDNKYVEDLLRRTKAVAKNAGISIEAMMGIIEHGKRLAVQHPETASLGNVGINEQTLKSFQSAQVLSTMMGSGAVREAGGTVGVINKQVELDRSNDTEPISNRLYALRGFVENAPMSEEHRNKARQILKNYANNPSGDFSQRGIDRMTSELGQVTGNSNTTLYRSSRSTMLNELGRKHAEDDRRLGREDLNLGKAGQNMQFSEASKFSKIFMQQHMNIHKNDEFSFKNEKGEVLKDSNAAYEEMMNDLRNTRGNGKRKEDVFAKYKLDFERMYPGGSPEELETLKESFYRSAMESSPDYKEDYAKVTELNKGYAVQEANMARRMAKLQAPIGSVLAQGLISGDMSKGIQYLHDTLSTPDAQERSSIILKSIENMGIEGTGLSQAAAFYEQHGGAPGLAEDEVRKNLSKQGLSGDEINASLKERAAYDPDAIKAIEGSGVTLHQLLNSVKDGEKGYKKSKAAAQGVKFEDAQRAATMLKDSGLLNKENQAPDKYGNRKVNAEMMQGLITDSGINASASMLEADAMKEEQTIAAGKIENALTTMDVSNNEGTRKQAEHLRGTLKKAGYMSDDGKINAKAIAEGYDQTLAVGDKRIAANEEVKGTLLDGDFKGLSDYKKAVKTRADEMRETISTGTNDQQAKALRELQDTIGNSTDGLSDILTKIADALGSLSRVNP